MHGKSRHMEIILMFFGDILPCASEACGFYDFLVVNSIIPAYFQPGIYPQFIP